MTTPISPWRPKSCTAKGLWRVARLVREDQRRRRLEELLRPGGKRVKWFRSYAAAARYADRVNAQPTIIPWNGHVQGMCNCGGCAPERVSQGREYYEAQGRITL